MEYNETLSEMGLVELPRIPEANGFTHPIIFTLPAKAISIMKYKHSLTVDPNAIIVKGGVISDNWELLSIHNYKPVRYKFIIIDTKKKCLNTLLEVDGSPMEMTEWNSHSYDLRTWGVYIAKKYFQKYFSEI